MENNRLSTIENMLENILRRQDRLFRMNSRMLSLIECSHSILHNPFINGGGISDDDDDNDVRAPTATTSNTDVVINIRDARSNGAITDACPAA
jgi:hypothetical protein